MRRSLLLHHSAYRRLVRIHIIRAVRRWETRPLARRKQEVVGGGIVALLCLLSSLAYHPGSELQNPNADLVPLRVVRETTQLPTPPVGNDTLRLEYVKAKHKRLMTLLKQSKRSRTSPPVSGRRLQAPTTRLDTALSL